MFNTALTIGTVTCMNQCLQVGDAVYGRAALLSNRAHGSYAEYALAKATDLAHKPSNVSYEQAAALPVAALTALVGLK